MLIEKKYSELKHAYRNVNRVMKFNTVQTQPEVCHRL